MADPLSLGGQGGQSFLTRRLLAHLKGLPARPGTSPVGIASVSLLIAGCMSVVRPVPSPETRVLGDIRGVVLDDGAEGSRVEFWSVAEVQWTSDALVITGIVDSPGRTGRSQLETRRFPLDHVSHVLVRETSPGRAFWMSLGVGAATGAALMLLMALGI